MVVGAFAKKMNGAHQYAWLRRPAGTEDVYSKLPLFLSNQTKNTMSQSNIISGNFGGQLRGVDIVAQ